MIIDQYWLIHPISSAILINPPPSLPIDLSIKYSQKGENKSITIFQVDMLKSQPTVQNSEAVKQQSFTFEQETKWSDLVYSDQVQIKMIMRVSTDPPWWIYRRMNDLCEWFLIFLISVSLTFGLSLQRHVDVVRGAAQTIVGLHSHSLELLVPLKAVGGRRLDPLPRHGATRGLVLNYESIHAVGGVARYRKILENKAWNKSNAGVVLYSSSGQESQH